MTDDTQPEALRLAEEITNLECSSEAVAKTIAAAADELCRLHVENASLRASPAASPTPPAEQQAKPGAVYAELPEPTASIGIDDAWHEPAMRDFADRTHSSRLRCKSEQARLATLWGYVRVDATTEQAAPKAAPAPPSEREAFESTWENLYGKKPVLWDTVFKEAKMDVPAHSAGKYFYLDARAAWKAWQARAALAAHGGKV